MDHFQTYIRTLNGTIGRFITVTYDTDDYDSKKQPIERFFGILYKTLYVDLVSFFQHLEMCFLDANMNYLYSEKMENTEIYEKCLGWFESNTLNSGRQIISVFNFHGRQIYILFKFQECIFGNMLRSSILDQLENTLNTLSKIFVSISANMESLPAISTKTCLNSISVLGLRSYKSCNEEEHFHTSSLKLFPLNIILGKNGSGKSTILKSLALLKNAAGNLESKTALSLSGPYANIGIKGFGQQFEIRNTYQNIVKQESFTNRYQAELKVIFTKSKNYLKVKNIRITDLTKQERAFNVSFKDKSYIYSNSWSQVPERDIKGEVPSNNLIQIFKYLQARHSLPHIFPEIDSSLHILSANRNRSHRVYELQVGQLTYDGQNIEDEIMNSLEQDKIIKFISEWLVKLGFAKRNEKDDLAFRACRSKELPNAVSMQVHVSENVGWQDLMDVGSGVAHILPVLLRCYQADPTDTIILENPEHHLHHEAQAKLAHFLVEVAKECPSKRILVETQSVYLIKELQIIALEEPCTMDQLARVYYCIKGEDDVTRIQPISLTERDSSHFESYMEFDHRQNIRLIDAKLRASEEQV